MGQTSLIVRLAKLTMHLAIKTVPRSVLSCVTPNPIEISSSTAHFQLQFFSISILGWQLTAFLAFYKDVGASLSNLVTIALTKDVFWVLSGDILGKDDGTPLQYSCLENPMDGGAWWAAVHGVAKSRTRLSVFTFTFHFQALEKEMATHSSVLAWRIPGMGDPGGLPSMGSHRVGHDWSDLAA